MTTNQKETTANRAIVTTPADREILIEREFDAPRERVFAAFTNPGLIPRMVGPTEHDHDRGPHGGQGRRRLALH